MLSQKAIEKLKREATEDELKEIYSMFHKRNIINHWFTYVLNSKYARSVRLDHWINEQKGHPEIKKIALSLKDNNSHDITMQNILRYFGDKRQVGGRLSYVDDLSNYGSNEYWATIGEILVKNADDCDGFMTVIYLTALEAGVPDYRLYCTCGAVQGGYHAYVTYIADNLIMYAIDGCYWTKESLLMRIPYFDNPKYYYGSKEWWRFNSEGRYKIK